MDTTESNGTFKVPDTSTNLKVQHKRSCFHQTHYPNANNMIVGIEKDGELVSLNFRVTSATQDHNSVIEKGKHHIIFFGVVSTDDQAPAHKSRYGPVQFELELSKLMEDFAHHHNGEVDNIEYYVLGTTQYRKEYSHKILVVYEPLFREIRGNHPWNTLSTVENMWKQLTNKKRWPICIHDNGRLLGEDGIQFQFQNSQQNGQGLLDWEQIELVLFFDKECAFKTSAAMSFVPHDTICIPSYKQFDLHCVTSSFCSTWKIQEFRERSPDHGIINYVAYVIGKQKKLILPDSIRRQLTAGHNTFKQFCHEVQCRRDFQPNSDVDIWKSNISRPFFRLDSMPVMLNRQKFKDFMRSIHVLNDQTICNTQRRALHEEVASNIHDFLVTHGAFQVDNVAVWLQYQIQRAEIRPTDQYQDPCMGCVVASAIAFDIPLVFSKDDDIAYFINNRDFIVSILVNVLAEQRTVVCYPKQCTHNMEISVSLCNAWKEAGRVANDLIHLNIDYVGTEEENNHLYYNIVKLSQQIYKNGPLFLNPSSFDKCSDISNSKEFGSDDKIYFGRKDWINFRIDKALNGYLVEEKVMEPPNKKERL